MTNVRHGIGNIRSLSIPQNYLSLFKYSYTYVVITPGGRPSFLGIALGNDCNFGRGAWDTSRFVVGSVSTSNDVQGKQVKPIGCKTPTDSIHHLGCAYTVTLSNCAIEMPLGTASCQTCNPGYGLSLVTGYTYNCVACPTNCKTCTIGGASCTVCSPGYIRTKPGANYICTARTAGTVYNPALQSEYPGTTLSPSAFTLNGGTGAYESTTTISVPSTGSVFIEATIDVPYSSSEAAKYDLNLFVGGQLVQVRTVPYQAGNPSSYSVKFYAVINNLPANPNLEIKFAAKGAVTFGAGGLVSAVQTYNTGANCMFSNSAGGCLLCNKATGYYLLNGVCTAFSNINYVVSPGLGANEVLMPCNANPLVVTCTGPNAGEALSCIGGYYLSGGDCLQCNGNCQTCSGSALNCLTCSSPPLLQPGAPNTCVAACNSNQFVSGSTCTSCHASCLTCNGAASNNCQTCPSDKYLNAGSCLPCNTNCLTCTTTSTNCVTCGGGLPLLMAGSNTCVASCNSNQFDNAGTCTNCDPSCLTCTATGPTSCTTCASNHYLGGSSCYLCNGNCLTCSGSALNCLTCLAPPLLQPGAPNTCVAACNSNQFVSGSTCTNCDPSCLTCNGAASNNCQTCAPGQYLNAGSCLPCNTNCLTCTILAINCVTCGGPTPFKQPGSPTTCVASCNSNQFDNAGTCTNCDPSCLTCTGGSLTSCSTCAVGNYLSGGSCQSCTAPCTACTAAGNTQCTTCVPGFQTLGQTYCYQCHASCQSCNGPANTDCTSCPPGASLIGGQCIVCHSSCASCSGSTATQCTSCSSGKFLAADNSCQTCDSSCLTCTAIGSSSCATCPPSRKISSKNCAGPGCCYLCEDAHCKECSGDGICASCDSGFELLNSICTTPVSSANSTLNTTLNESLIPSEYLKVKIVPSLNRVKWEYRLVFSKMLNLRQLFNISQISYDNSLFELDFVCFNSSTKVDTCSTPIKFREGLEIKNLIITLEVRETTNFTEDKAYLPSQSIRLAENVSYYVDSTVSAAAVKQAYYSTSTASQAVQGIAIVSSSGSFSGFIKLTQAIEMVLYFNFNKPANFQSFLTFFSNNIFSLAYNPMADSIAQDCSLPAAFTDNGVSCSFLDNTGQLFLVFGVVGLLKLIVLGCLKLAQKHPRLLKGLQFANNALSLNLVLMLLDALMFDFLLAAMVALRSFSTASISSIINLLLAVATLGFYIFEIVFTFYYCRIMHVLKVQDQGPPNLSRQSSEEFKPQIAKTDNEFTKMKALPSSRVNIDDDKFKFEAARDFKPKPLISRLNITHYTEERNSEAITGRYFTAIDQSKLFVCCILVVSLFDYPFVQIGLIAACQTAVSFWYAFRRPHSSLKENFKCIMTEALLGCTMTLCILLVDGSGVLEAPADRFLYLGYPLIAISSLLFVTILIFNIYEAVQAIVSKIKKLSQKKVGVIYPVNKDLGKPENLIPIQYLKGDNHTLLENKSELSPTSSTSGSTKKIRVRKELKLALQSGNQSPTTKIKKIGPLLVSGGLKIKMNPP